MVERIKLFSYIDLETISTCNRTCSTCIRNSHPDRKKLRSWFEPHHLPIKTIHQALDQCGDLGFVGGVCLSHYNEPLMDERIAQIGQIVKSCGIFHPIFLNTNGDFITEDIAQGLDGVLDKIIVSLYMKEPIKSERKAWIQSLFHKTHVDVNTNAEHFTTHYSPMPTLDALIETHRGDPCKTEPKLHLIINHRRQYLLCCDDVIGNFDLGTFPEIGIEDYWFGDKHTKILNDLDETGGRLLYSYCSTCPRP